MTIERIRVVDTHTGGEPTRVVVESPLDLGSHTMLQLRSLFAERFDGYRRAIVCEPRGSDVMVAALLTPPERAGSVAGVIFFNNIGYLGMCGHGAMGVAVALAHCNRIGAGIHTLDTPVGPVQLNFRPNGGGAVAVANVPSYRFCKQVVLQLDDRTVHGDIAWGGNWFFICEDHGLPVELRHLEQLHGLARTMRSQLDRQGITGADGAVIDHIELIGPASDSRRADAKNFVLCPGGAYDRSPCGTGTSAKLACLAADGKLAPGAIHRQESIVGSIFTASYQFLPPNHDSSFTGGILPTIEGNAFVNAEAELLLDPNDPFCMGIVA